MRRNGSPRIEPESLRLEDLSSEDGAMVRCLKLAVAAARTDLPILILGESGSGKTLLARAIHNSSRRPTGAFVSFNAAALSETLLDSQLFGHERGAFTGAHKPVKGKFELADGGTLFLDEIADMSSTAQAKILRAVEYGEYDRLGSEQLRVADVRLISATHWPSRWFLNGGDFRRDLFYRISGITLTLPPLRERPHDLRALIARETSLAAQEQDKEIRGFEKTALESLLGHAWPGNLRELRRVIEAAVALTESEVIPADVVLLDGAEDGGQPAAESESDPAAAPARTLAEAERQHIHRTMQACGGNKRQAARTLGISRTTLDRKLASP